MSVKVKMGKNQPDVEGGFQGQQAGFKNGSNLEGFGSSFSDKAIRAKFVRKVYSIIFAQLAVTAAIVAIFAYTPQIRRFYRSPETATSGLIIYIVSYVVFVVTYITILCCKGVRKSYPGNIITLAIFTLALSFLSGSIAVYNNADWVMIAMGITAALCLILTLFACQTKWDFTGCGVYLYGACWCVFLFGIIAIIFWHTGQPVLHAVYCGLVALVFSGFLIYDTQMIIGGKKHEISAEEHIVGAIQIYLDVVNIFLAIVGLGRH